MDLTQIRQLVTNPETIQVDGHRPVILAHESMNVHDIQKYLNTPNRVCQRTDIKTIQSFCDYYRYMQAKSPAIFVCNENRSITAIFDFHGNANQPAWQDNSAIFRASFDPNFSEWEAHNKEWFTQKDFAEFLEDRCVDCSSPSASEIMTLVTNFEQTTEVQFKSDIRLQDGAQNIAYNDEERTGKIQIPKTISLYLPVFEGEEAIFINARLKIRVKDAKLMFHYEIINLKQLLNMEFTKIVDAMVAEIEPPLVIR